jgi:hypothetical protein
MKYGVAIILAICAGLFYDCTLRPRKGAHDFLVSKGWGAELPKEEVDEAEESQVEQACDEQCEERVEKLRALQRQIMNLSFMLSSERLPRAWHREMAPSERRPWRLGNKCTPPHRLSPKRAAEAIMAAIANLPEPPPLSERTNEEAIVWDKIAQVRSGAMLVLEGRHPGYSSLSVMLLKKSKHRRTK